MRRQLPGQLPARSPAVLLILDMISDFDFPDGAAVARAARRIAPAIARLKARAAAARISCIYVNDNPGRWRSDSPALIAHCLEPGRKGRDIVEQLKPSDTDYFVLKPRHSAFYATPLDVLLEHIGAKRLILTGVSSLQCVLFTATDAHVRSFEVIVPSDCIGGPSSRDGRFALRYFDEVLNAKVAPASRLDLRRLNRSA